jgi:hypothetical protein
MGGEEQGQPCASDTECVGGTCTRHGHPLTCPEQCLGSNPDYRCPSEKSLSFPFGGLRGDVSGDRVVGYCSTENNRNLTGHPAGITWGGLLAYDGASNPARLWLSESGGSSAKAWEGAAMKLTDAPATLLLGQRSFLQHDWWLTGGDCTINCNAVPYSFDQDGGVFASTGPDGEVWIGDQVWARKYDQPVKSGAKPDLLLCRTRTDGGTQRSEASRCRPKQIAVSAAGRVALVDSRSRVMIWNVSPTETAEEADVVLGAPDPTTRPECNLGGLSARSLCHPISAAFTSRGDLVVSDTGNHRILVFTPCHRPNPGDFCDNQEAATVLCQPDFVTASPGTGADKCDDPRQVSTAGKAVAAADANNHRVLVWRDPKASRKPDHVIGQSSLDTKSTGLSGSDINRPIGVAIGGGDIYVSFHHPDYRILRFAYPVRANKPEALSVLGQPDFTSRFPGKVSNLSGLFDSASVAFNGRGVYVSADAHRILYWADKFDASKGLPATFVLGQDGGPNDRLPNRGGAVSARGFNSPSSVAVDAAGSLYVSDMGNHRILVFDDPTRTDRVADRVFGQQGAFTTSLPNGGGPVSAGGLRQPTGTHLDPEGTLWVADTFNHRVLAFCHKSAAMTGLCTDENSGDDIADLVLGQVDFESHDVAGCNTPTSSTLCYPQDVFHDLARKRLFVVDATPAHGGFARILVYTGKLQRAGKAASSVLGAPDMKSFPTCNEPKATTGCRARSIVAHPRSGHLYVLESPGMVEYGRFETGAPARRCFGMLDCTRRGGGSGYVTCAWSTADGELGIDTADNEIWVPGAGEGAQGIMILLDPEAATPTPTPTPATVTPTESRASASGAAADG